MMRVITKPDGRPVSLRSYVASWKILKTVDPAEEIKGWTWYAVPAREILRDLHYGMHDRINRHIPGFGVGRKWDDRSREHAAQWAREKVAA